MKPLKIILTACGCPGASTLIRMLKNNGERDIEIIGTDMDNEAVGRFLADKFYVVPHGGSEHYIPTMLDIVEKESPDVVLPEGDPELYPLACNKNRFKKLGTEVMVSDPESVELAINKFKMYEVLSKATKIPLPKYNSAESLDEFHDAITYLGYPDRPVVFKPHVGRGSRGVRIIDSGADRRTLLMEKKPISKYISLEEFNEIFINSKDFPRFLVMEYLKGIELTTDTIAFHGRELLTTVKTVEQARWGVIVRGELVKNKNLLEQTREILKTIPMSYCINLQFIDGKLLEINARVSTFLYQEDLIAPYLAIKLAIGELNEENLKAYSSKIDYGRRMVRYMDQVFHKAGELIDF